MIRSVNDGEWHNRIFGGKKEVKKVDAFRIVFRDNVKKNIESRGGKLRSRQIEALIEETAKEILKLENRLLDIIQQLTGQVVIKND